MIRFKKLIMDGAGSLSGKGTVSPSVLRELRGLKAKVEAIVSENRKYLERTNSELQSVLAQITTVSDGIARRDSVPLGSTSSASSTASASASESPADRPESSGMKRQSGEHSASHGGKRPKGEFVRDSEGFVHVHTDGACTNNGKPGAKAGIGIWWDHGSPHNQGVPVVGGRHTNNTAEIQAATIAIAQARGLNIRKLLIHTDSMFLINCVTKWMPNWKRNSWRTAEKKPVKNKEDLEALDAEITNGGITVKWNHVAGHSGVPGNEAADSLARRGANLA